MRKRGSIGESWWSRRFIEPLEETADTGRLSRGRSYARGGAVLSLSVSPGVVTADVRGSRSYPYQVRIGLWHYSDELWSLVCASLARQALYRSALLAGDMPDEIEGVFEELGAPLFPDHFDDLTVSCTCPDWGYPCKHVASVLYTLAEAFDEDPFLILTWLGRDRESLLAEIRGNTTGSDSETTSVEQGLAVRVSPLSEDVTNYWSAQRPPSFAPPATVANPGTHLETDITGLKQGLARLYQALDEADAAE